MLSLKNHECLGSFGTLEAALTEIGKLLAVQTSREVLLIGVDAPLSFGTRKLQTTSAPRSLPSAKMIHLFRTAPQPAQTGSALTPHEFRVLSLLVEGHNYKTAAVELGVSVNTISFHIRRVYEKLQVHSKSEAVAKALKNHLV